MRRNEFGNPHGYPAKQIRLGWIDRIIEIKNPIAN
jgi:hypothetical protein